MSFSAPKIFAIGAACSVGLGLFWVFLRNQTSTRRIPTTSSARNINAPKKKKAAKQSRSKPAAASASATAKSEQDDMANRIKKMLDDAEVFKSKHQYAKAQQCYLELIMLVERTFGRYTGACFYAYQALAILLTQVRELNVAAEATEKYLDIARKLPNAEDKVVEALSELAFLYFQLDRFEDSLRCNTEARAIAEKIVATAPTSANAEAITPSKRAYIDWTMSRVEQQIGQLDKAEANCRFALQWLSSPAAPADTLKLDVEVTLASILFDLNKRDEALQLFNRIASDFWVRFASDVATLLQYVRLLVKAETDRGLYELAVEQCQRAITLAEGKKDLRDSVNAIRSELSTIRRLEGREDDAKELEKEILTQIRTVPELVPPYVTSRFVITTSSLLLPPKDSAPVDSLTRYTYNLTLKFREEFPVTAFPAKTVLPPAHTVSICVLFENPADSTAPVKIECKKGPTDRQLKVISPALEGFKTGTVYKCSVFFMNADSKELIGEHTQYFKLFANDGK